MTDIEIEDLAERIAFKIKEEHPKGLIVHILEHEATGAGRVVDAARARATQCRCFVSDDEEYCWSPGILGLMSSKKNPEQISEFCALGKEPGGAGAQKRFREIKFAVGEAHREWEKGGGGLKEWWQKVGEALSEKGIEL